MERMDTNITCNILYFILFHLEDRILIFFPKILLPLLPFHRLKISKFKKKNSRYGIKIKGEGCRETKTKKKLEINNLERNTSS